MSENNFSDFAMEKKLKALDPDLHRRFRDMVFVVQKMLSRYRLIFPEYTDHSELHSMTVINFCNKLIYNDEKDKLNKDEMYILLNACYLHDIGMGLTDELYEEFRKNIDEKAFWESHPNATKADFIRTYHNEFSGMYIEKYADLFEFPSEDYIYAIKQVARGHRKTDLLDENEYSPHYEMLNGNKVCLPYLSALLRLADEIDVVAERNPKLLYDLEALTDEIEIKENRKLDAVKELEMEEDSFVLKTDTQDEEMKKDLIEMVRKMQQTLNYVNEVLEKRTPFRLSQIKVVLEFL